jgi:hypothetical protein
MTFFLLIWYVHANAIPAEWKYNHLGIPTQEHNKDELYDKQYKYYTWGYEKSEFNIQMHRFDKDAPFPEIIKKYPHVAFLVPELKQAIKGRKVVWGPIESKPGIYVAMIEDPATGMPVELLQSKLNKAGMIKLHEKLIKKNR